MAGIYDRRYPILRRRLREARLKAGLTQVAAGERMGSNQQFINRCEAGDRRIDALEVIDFAKLYGCDPAWFLDLGDLPASRGNLAE